MGVKFPGIKRYVILEWPLSHNLVEFSEMELLVL